MFWPQAASKEQRAERRKRSFSPKPFSHFFLLARGGRFQGHRGPRPARFDAQGQWILTRGQGAARGPRDPQSTPPKDVPSRPSPKKLSQAKSVEGPMRAQALRTAYLRVILTRPETQQKKSGLEAQAARIHCVYAVDLCGARSRRRGNPMGIVSRAVKATEALVPPPSKKK